MTWQSKALRFGGPCASCGTRIEPREVGWHDADLKKVRCAQCGPEEVDFDADQGYEPRQLNPDPVGGSAALREARARRDPKWLKGAAGEYEMSISLQNRLRNDAVTLTDRRVPGTNSNIDHIVIAPSGVWIIDTKNWTGKIEYKSASLTDLTMHLYVGGKDRTSKVESIYGLVIPVAQILEDRSIPIHPALVFVESSWKATSIPRFLLGKTYRHGDIYMAPPKALIKTINEPGPLDEESIIRIVKKLDQSLKPR